MVKRKKQLSALSDDPIHVDAHLDRARQRNGETDDERAASVRALHSIYRTQIGRGAFADIRLQNFFDREAHQIWASENPVAAMKAFLGRQTRGAKSKYAYRDFLIAVEVAERMQKGQNRDEACIEVGASAGRSPEHVKNIYARRPKETVKLELGRRKYEGTSGA